MPAECAVAASSVVVLDPGGKGGGALGVAGECLPVGPFGGQGAVEAFDLAVLPGAVRLDELLPGAQCGDDLAQRPPVGPGVVGHHPLDPGNAVGGEVGRAAGEEPGAGAALLVGQHLGVGQPRVVIDQRVHAVIAELAGAVAGGLPGGAAVRPPAA